MILKDKLSDLWQTPMWLFNQLQSRFNLVVDACATEHNSLCDFYIPDALDPLNKWSRMLEMKNYPELLDHNFGYYLNPPYSDCSPFVGRAWEESKNNLVVCLLKADPSTKWWGIFWDYQTQQPRAGCRLEYPHYKGRNQGRRVKFEPPSKEILEQYLEFGTEKDKKLAKSLLEGKVTTPAFPSVVAIFDRRHL